MMNYIDGIWYELLCSEDEIAGTNICDYIDNSGIYPYWICSAEIKEDLKVLVINDSYLDSFIEILKYLVGKSPINTIFLFFRFQSDDAEVVCGTLSLENFKSLLEQKRILTNVCYSISSQAIKSETRIQR